MYYPEMCNEFAGPVSASLHPGLKVPFEEMLQRWRAVGKIAFELAGPIFEVQNSRSRNKRVTIRSINRFGLIRCFTTFRASKNKNTECSTKLMFKLQNLQF